ncbi:MAG: glycosyltransferase [Ferrimicrobium acidiphilum]
MFVVGVCIGDEVRYANIAFPAIRQRCPRGTLLIELRDQVSIHAAYNSILAIARDVPDLDGVIFIHEDLEILDAELVTKIEGYLRDSSVGIVGAIGAIGVESLSWWDGEIRGALMETRGMLSFPVSERDVDMVDGCFVALSAAAVRALSFREEDYSGFHGYDAEICFAARLAGMRVIVGDFDLFHACRGGLGDVDSYACNNYVFQERWGLGSGLRSRDEDPTHRKAGRG